MQATVGWQHGADMEQAGVFPIQSDNTTITLIRDRDVTFCEVTRQLAQNTELVANTDTNTNKMKNFCFYFQNSLSRCGAGSLTWWTCC